MLNFPVSLLAILIFLTAAYGWGRLVADRLYFETRPGWAFMAVFGLGIWIFLGGILNAAHLAFPLVLDTIILLGIGFTISICYSSFGKSRIISFYRNVRLSEASSSRDFTLLHLLPTGLIVSVLVFLSATLIPASAFNAHDDFHVYMARPFQMLQTGSLAGNPYDALGVDSLGAQAYLHAFFVNHLPASFINAFDLVSCFVLALLLLKEIGVTQKKHCVFVLASLILFIAINPMYVNISSLYSGSLMVLGAIYSFLIFPDLIRSNDYKRMFTGALLVSVFISSLVALKLTFVFFAITSLAVYFGLWCFFSERKSSLFRAAGISVLTALALITPWVLVSLPNYLSAWHLVTAGQTLPGTGENEGMFIANILTVFSLAKTTWGSHFLNYSLLVLSLGVAASVSLIQLVNSRDPAQQARLIAVCAVCIAGVASYFASLSFLDPHTAVRYSIPILIPVASVTLLMSSRDGTAMDTGSFSYFRRPGNLNPGNITLLTVAVLITAAFAQELFNRINRAYHQRTQLSFPVDKLYLQYNEAVLGRPAAEWVRNLQDKIVTGRPIFSMISVPHHFDFGRNPIYLYTESGIMNPWLALPLNKHPEELRKYLAEHGVQYVIFETQGYGIKQDIEYQIYLKLPYWMFREIGDRSIKLRAGLRYLADNSQLIYRDNRVVLFDLNQITTRSSSSPLSDK